MYVCVREACIYVLGPWEGMEVMVIFLKWGTKVCYLDNPRTQQRSTIFQISYHWVFLNSMQCKPYLAYVRESVFFGWVRELPKTWSSSLGESATRTMETRAGGTLIFYGEQCVPDSQCDLVGPSSSMVDSSRCTAAAKVLFVWNHLTL